MNKNEQDVIQKIQEKTDSVKVPENLEPECVAKTLEERGKKRRNNSWRVISAAAACLVVIAGMAAYRSGTPNHAEPRNDEIKISDSKSIAEATDYNEVYGYIEGYEKERERDTIKTDESAAGDVNGLMEDTGTVQSAQEEKSMDYGNYSDTNVRQEGVDEGDVVKTDGRYLYVLKNNHREVSVVDTRDNTLEEVRTIAVEDTEWIQEVYLDSERKQLVFVCSKYKEDDSTAQARGGYWYAGITEVITYNIADLQNPKELARITQSGQYQSSRLSEGCLYVFSNYSVVWDYVEKEKPETYIPLINDAAMEVKDICLPAVSSAQDYTVVTAIDMRNPGKVNDSKAVLSQGGELYVSNKNIYYYETIWGGQTMLNKEQTTIRRISYQDGKLKAEAQGKISGYITDSFSIDEYDGYLRVVTTQGSTNAVYVLDMALEKVGSIEGLAEDERVYSARLMGDTGYFVTFRETDPLFSVDFSSPEDPKIVGSLKIPGFSDYLHPYGAGKLLGIGMNVDEETTTTDGAKLTMFDISNPEDVKEEHTYVLKDVYSTDVSYDYKAALVDDGRNIIGFAGYTDGGQKYYIFEYDEEEGFLCRMAEEINGSSSSAVRGIYIGDTLYVVQGNIIESYSLKEYEKIDDIIL